MYKKQLLIIFVTGTTLCRVSTKKGLECESVEIFAGDRSCSGDSGSTLNGSFIIFIHNFLLKGEFNLVKQH